MDHAGQAHISFAFKVFRVLTRLLRGQATDTYGAGQAMGQITCSQQSSSICVQVVRAQTSLEITPETVG